jgi:hypothetical protein
MLNEASVREQLAQVRDALGKLDMEALDQDLTSAMVVSKATKEDETWR